MGLIIGSFLNVVILRLPRRLEYDWDCQCRELLNLEPESPAEPAPTLSSPPSTCPGCGHRIRAVENIPVLSYLFLRGKCASCGAGISFRYPFVELLTAVGFLVVALHFGPTVQGLAALAFTALLIALAGIDIDHQLLPDNLTLALLWIGLLMSPWTVFSTPVDSILGAAIGYGSLWAVFHGFKLLTGKEGLGYGDFKLMGALGAWMGWQSLLAIILLSSLVGACVGIALLLTRRLEREQPMPFGPFIAGAGWIALLWGDEITNFFLLSLAP